MKNANARSMLIPLFFALLILAAFGLALPSVTYIYPQDGTNLSNQTVEFMFNVTTDDDNLTVSLYLDNGLVTTFLGVPNSTLASNISNYYPTVHTYYVNASNSTFTVKGSNVNFTTMPMITKLPYRITYPGVYNMSSNLVGRGTGIQIDNYNNIVLDCNGFSITGDRAGYGINVSSGLRNITIKNCGFSNYSQAVHFENTNDSTIFNSTFTNNPGPAVLVNLGFNLLVNASIFDSNNGSTGGTFDLTSVNNSRFIFNTIYNSTAGAGGVAYLYTSNNNTFMNNSIGFANTKNGAGGAYYVEYSSYNTFFGDSLNYTNINGYGGYARVGAKLGNTDNTNNTFDSIFIGYASAYQGAALYSAGDYVTFKNSIIMNAVASQYGGSFALLGKGNVIDSNFVNASAALMGGTFYVKNESQYILNNVVNNSYASNHGGTFYLEQFLGPVVRNNTIVSSASAQYGGTYYLTDASGVCANGVFSNNVSFSNGSLDGGVYYISGACNNNMFRNENIFNTTSTAIVLTNATYGVPVGNSFTNVNIINFGTGALRVNSLADNSALNLSLANTSLLSVPVVLNVSVGRFTFLPGVNSTGDSLTLMSIITLANNMTSVNSSLAPGFNQTAIVELRGNNFVDPKILVSTGGAYSFCNETTDPSCTNLSYASGVFTFNTSHFTTFTLQEGTGAPSVIPGVYNPDIFFSPFDKMVNLSVNVTSMVSIVSVSANFSGINESICGSGIINLTLDSRGFYTGNCSVGAYIPNGSMPYPGTIVIIATDNVGNVNVTPFTILLQDMGVMGQPQTACERLSSASTNFTTVLNFSNVNLVNDLEINFSCLTMGQVPVSSFQKAMLLNLTSVNLSSQSQAAKLSNLSRAINVTITQPQSFGNSVIFVDTTIFSELNTSAMITLYGLPFTSAPAVKADYSYELSSTAWASNGFDSNMGVITGNLTLVVTGFSGYNATDNVTPVVRFISPVVNQTNATVLINLTVNGTLTQLSTINITIGQYNYTSSTANCNATSPGSELYLCTFVSGALSDGVYVINVTAIDYGGVSGNILRTNASVTIDSTAPVIYNATAAPLIGSAGFIMNISANVYDSIAVDQVIAKIMLGTASVANVSLIGTGSLYNGTWNSSGAANGTYSISFFVNDSFGASQSPALVEFTITGVNATYMNTTVNANMTSPMIINESGTNMTIVLYGNITNGTIALGVSNTSALSPPSGLYSLGHFLTIVASSTVSSNMTTATIYFYYSDADIPSGVDESTLKIYYYNQSQGAWVVLDPSGVDTVNNIAWGNTTHFSEFGLYGSQPSASLGPGGGSAGGGGGSRASASDFKPATTPATYMTSLGKTYGIYLDSTGKTYSVSLTSIKDNRATFMLKSSRTTFSMNVGEKSLVDITGDGEGDVLFDLTSLNTKSATLKLSLPSTLTPVTTPAPADAVPSTAPATEAKETVAPKTGQETSPAVQERNIEPVKAPTMPVVKTAGMSASAIVTLLIAIAIIAVVIVWAVKRNK